MQDRQGEEHLSRFGLVQGVTVPFAALEHQVSDVDSFNVLVFAQLLDVLVFYCGGVGDVVKRPGLFLVGGGLFGGLLFVGSGHLLLHGCQEPLGIEESS